MNITIAPALLGSSAPKRNRKPRLGAIKFLFVSVAFFATPPAWAQSGLPPVRTPSDNNPNGAALRSNSPVLTSAPSDSATTGMPGGVCRLVGGMAAAQLKQCFGEPDEVGEERGRQVWHYGDCELYVAEERLVAWLNPEDLADRRRMAALARKTDKDYDPTDKAHWVNEWTPRKEVLPQEELLDLVGEDEGQKKTEAASETVTPAEDTAAKAVEEKPVRAKPAASKGPNSQDESEPYPED